MANDSAITDAEVCRHEFNGGAFCRRCGHRRGGVGVCRWWQRHDWRYDEARKKDEGPAFRRVRLCQRCGLFMVMYDFGWGVDAARNWVEVGDPKTDRRIEALQRQVEQLIYERDLLRGELEHAVRAVSDLNRQG